MRRLETHYRDLCDIEFTVERGKLWMLQTRVGKRTAGAAFRIAAQLVDENLITMDEAIQRVTGEQLARLMFPQFDPAAEKTLLAKGLAASPGAAAGAAVFDSATAVERANAGQPVVLVRRETNPDDLEGMIAATGVLTSRGGKTSHAAVVARGMGRTCVCGAEALDIDVRARTLKVGDVTVNEGDVIAIDGTTGEVFLGDVPVVTSPVAQLPGGRPGRRVGRRRRPRPRSWWRRCTGSSPTPTTRGGCGCGPTPIPPTTPLGPAGLGAQGIGLCRTEHMFLGERRLLIERLVLADTPDERAASLEALLPLQREDFVQIFTAMDGLPVTVRLLDPPLHEFLPDRTELAVKVAVARERGEDVGVDEKLLAAVERLHESNPMLGLRGVRLGLTVTGLFGMQVRAIAEAAAARLKDGGDPHVEIMVPLIGSVMELHLIRDEADAILAEVAEAEGVDFDISIGTMIELPRAALTAGRIAEAADFFSFGTNDLTQTAWGFSRDDVEAAFFATYFDKGVLTVSPFETLDTIGVGRLVQIAVEEGRATKPRLKVGVCGEHGGDPESVHFFHEVGLDYVSCSPFRVPVARLEAGRAAVALDDTAAGLAGPR